MQALEKFLKKAILNGKRAILIVHGRGLSSPRQPVLKNKVCEWLVRSSWRKWVLAFCSARGYDGGAGATYVLLRKKPMTRGKRRRQSKKSPDPSYGF
jgi:DNA-nicking Smr family endonuclease